MIPMWDGKAETFSHFIVECKWSLQSSKASDRPLLAARIVRRALQSPHPTLVQLMYRLRPEDFRNEADVNKLIKYLEESPLNKQPLPDAGAKIGNYYRRLHRKHQEPVNAFLIREEKTHDDMIRALQRLLREKELSFEEYDMDMEALKNFCGFQPGQSLYYGPDDVNVTADEATDGPGDDTADERTQTPRGSQAGRPFSASAAPFRGAHSSRSTSSNAEPETRRGKDVLERLMEKGLMPLAALDHIRGWLLLEMTSTSDEDRRLIKAATRNRLTYSEVRNALLGMFEERTAQRMPFGGKTGGHRQYYQEVELYDSEYDPACEGEYGYYGET